MRVKDRVENGVSKRVGREVGGGGGGERFTSPLFHFLDLVPFLAWKKPKIPFLSISLLQKQMEMLARR